MKPSAGQEPFSWSSTLHVAPLKGVSSGILDSDLVWTENLCSYSKGKTLETRSSWVKGGLLQ